MVFFWSIVEQLFDHEEYTQRDFEILEKLYPETGEKISMPSVIGDKHYVCFKRNRDEVIQFWLGLAGFVCLLLMFVAYKLASG